MLIRPVNLMLIDRLEFTSFSKIIDDLFKIIMGLVGFSFFILR